MVSSNKRKTNITSLQKCLIKKKEVSYMLTPICTSNELYLRTTSTNNYAESEFEENFLLIKISEADNLRKKHEIQSKAFD